jgi:DNA mismatch endonuclease (patch repair protein)
MDVVDAATRSRMMSGIRGRNTTPELVVRSALHRAGLRYRLHRRDLPGSPDIVLPRFRTVVFVHGCFWHRHASCRYCTMPKTNANFWKQKFENNVVRDARQKRALRLDGWRVLTVWECDVGRPSVLNRLVSRIRAGAPK